MEFGLSQWGGSRLRGEKQRISVMVERKMTWEGKHCRFTGFYGEPCKELRKKSWDAIRYLRAQDNLPWICVGDYNEALFRTNQLGGNPRSLRISEIV